MGRCWHPNEFRSFDGPTRTLPGLRYGDQAGFVTIPEPNSDTARSRAAASVSRVLTGMTNWIVRPPGTSRNSCSPPPPTLIGWGCGDRSHRFDRDSGLRYGGGSRCRHDGAVRQPRSDQTVGSNYCRTGRTGDAAAAGLASNHSRSCAPAPKRLGSAEPNLFEGRGTLLLPRLCVAH